MVILRQQMRSKPERTEDVSAALAAIVPGARGTHGVISLDIARDLLDSNSFVATGIYEDGAALERQESAPEVHTVAGAVPLDDGVGGISARQIRSIPSSNRFTPRTLV